MNAKQKTVGIEEQEKRSKTTGNLLMGFAFVMLLGIPLFNLVLGGILLIALLGLIFRKSAQIGKDLGWLLIGTVLCLVGMLIYPGAQMVSSMSIGASIFLGVVIRAVVYFWIILGRFKHLTES